MIMQLTADPAHEYGSHGSDSGDAVVLDVCDACIWGIVLHVFACSLVSFGLEIMQVLARLPPPQ